MVEMTVRYSVDRNEIDTVTGEFVGVEIGPLASICLPLKTDEGWVFISFSRVIDIVCTEIPEQFVVSVQHMIDSIEMHKADFENELERRKTREDAPAPKDDTNWGHV